MRRTLFLALLLALLVPGAAHATTLVMTGDSTTERGYIGLQVFATADLETVEAGEVVDGEFRRIKDFTLQSAGIVPPFGPLNVGTEPRVATWDCTRRDREFMSIGHKADGSTATARFTFRTRDCKNRLEVKLPDRVRPGRTVTAVVRDTFGIGDVDLRFCTSGPGRASSCRVLTLPPGVDKLSTRFRAPLRGRYKVNLAAGPQAVKRFVSAGIAPRPSDLAHLPTILTTGDSMMQTVDQVLGDRLDGQVNVASDVKIASGITKPQIADWATLPGRQVRRFKPDVAILFLGANEEGPLTPPGSTVPISCCSAAWRAEYTRRAREVMNTYIGRKGEGGVVWLLNPVPGDPRRVTSMAAVNAAVVEAAEGVERARVVDLNPIYTPTGVYQDQIDGVPVRQDDKIHISLAGARFALPPIIAALRDLGVTAQRR